MPRPKTYEDAAAKQRAYRQRKQVQPAAPPAETAPALYRQWRGDLRAIVAQLGTIREQMGDYHEERSQRWKDSDKGGDFDADIDELEGIADSIMDLNMWRHE